MKTVRHDFSLEKYESGKYKVQTKDGKSVRIICTDKKSDYPIVALVMEDDNQEYYNQYPKNGETNCNILPNLGLVLIEEVFEDGDIVYGDDTVAIYKIDDEFYCGLALDTSYLWQADCSNLHISRLATEEEKKKLFNALVKEGKSWNADMKRIEDTVTKCELKPFDRVLVRDANDRQWVNDFFSLYSKDEEYPYYCICNMWKQCIPYEGNEELLGTTKNK